MNKGKKFVSLFLVFSLLALYGNLYAKKKGAELIVRKKDGQEISGELIAVKENSLLMLVSRVDYSVDIGDVSVIKVKKSEALLGGFIGLILGIGIGYMVGYSQDSWSKESAGAMGMAIGGPIGAGVGVGIGSGVSTYRKVQIEGRADSEIKEVLEKLRKKARIPDYQ